MAEIDKTNRYNGTFSIIYIDIDHFKEVNDQYKKKLRESWLCDTIIAVIHK